MLSSSATSLIEWTQQSNTEEKLIVKIKAPTRTRCGSCTSKLHFLFRSSTLSGGQVETDKWPLALARLRGQAQAVLGVRRGRESFDGFRQIANCFPERQTPDARRQSEREWPKTKEWGVARAVYLLVSQTNRKSHSASYRVRPWPPLQSHDPQAGLTSLFSFLPSATSTSPPPPAAVL